MTSIAAERLVRNKARIIQEWEARARRELPSGRFKDELALLDSLPIFLDEISDTIAAAHNDTAGRTGLRVPKEHGAQRANLGDYTLHDLILEFKILQEILLGILSEEGPLDDVDEKVVLDAIFRGIIESAVEFSRRQLEFERDSRLRAEEAARNLNEEQALRTQFVCALSHDLRNPLNSIRLNAEVTLHSHEKSEKIDRSMRAIVKNVELCSVIIDDVMDANLLYAGETLPLNVADCAIEKIVEEVAESVAALHKVQVTVEGEPIQMRCDREKVRRALENLVVNAVKYRAKDTPVRIMHHRSGNAVNLSVHNQGPAIPEHEIELLFKRFYRTTDAKRSGKGGYGLGLVIVKGVAEAHHGTVSVTSNAQNGTTFTLSLPI